MKLKNITAVFLTATLLFSSVPVSYPSSIFAAETVSEVHAEIPLDSDNVRFTVVDYDTGEKIALDKEFSYFAIVPYIWASDDTQQNPSTVYLYPDSNPYIWEQTISEGETINAGLADGSLNDNYYLPDDYEEITRYENGSVDVVIKLKSNEGFELPPGSVRVTVTDGDTGELIPDEVFAKAPLTIGTNIVTKGGVTGPIIMVEKNRAVIKENLASLYKSADKFELYFDGESEIKVYDNNSMDIFLTTAPKAEANGDVNDDGEFNVADVVLLQKWLLAVPDTHLVDWKAADFCNDNVLNVFDLCLMKQELTKKMVTTYVEPDERFEWGVPFYVVNDGLKLYSGPDESYDVIASIPADTRLTESGVKKNNNTWLFTEYNGQCGWINTLGADGKMVIRFDEVAKKPVIYLYPEKEKDVHVELELTESELNTTYPKYDNGWDVTAYPDGTLLNNADGSHHRYLFWDAVNCRTRFDFSKGFCVAGSDTESFLKEKLTYMGLNEQEMNEFIVFWLPLMEHNAYNLISFQGDVYTNSAKLNITPEPDCLLRVFMAYVPLKEAVDIEPQQLNTFERKGFTVVEWGGAEVNTFNVK
ncbi:dockerin type I domain-containing protein [Ruminococcus sp.]|uniref:dockerin type I domain-containing protein n=1 Tax=Ruminococcus sp. TaxID=41978 RepID=UPI0025E2CB85|nr:dockerin type I domain-containing protein [Ruminococcus sp.]MBR1431340.1 hypothetical protein [Ruminococcus sp.]